MIEILKILLKNNKFPQSSIFNSGNIEVPFFVIKYLFCENKEVKPCNACLSCKKVNKRVHPDLFVVDIEEGAKNIKINQIREVKNFCSMTTSGRCKAVFINNAEFMSIEAQNSILKILEEPGDNNYFLLKTKNKYKLLPTILSRCVHFNLKPVDNFFKNEEFSLKNLKKLSFFEVYDKLNELIKEVKNLEDFLKILIYSNYPDEIDFLFLLLNFESYIKYNINKDTVIGVISFWIKGGENCQIKFVT